jgi:hypothetical protein
MPSDLPAVHSMHIIQSLKEDIPATPPLNSERLPHTLHRSLTGGRTTGYGQPDSLGHQHNLGNGHRQQHHHCYTGHQCYGSVGLASTPKLSSISGAKTETSSMDASMRSSSSPEEVDRSRELSVSVSNASDQEREWVEEDEPGVYITIRALPGGIRELRRVRFRFATFTCCLFGQIVTILAQFYFIPSRLNGLCICEDITAQVLK